jgi:hypothetical protein
MSSDIKINKFWKVILTSLLSLVLIGVAVGTYSLFSGNYFLNASLTTSAFILIAIVVVVYLVIQGFKKIWQKKDYISMALVIVVLSSLQACQYAKSNQQVVISTDCGSQWKKITPGDHVPTGTTNPCYMKVVMPNYPMQGESRFIANLAEKVRVTAHIDYDYSIVEALAFINQAKYLGSANQGADSNEALNASAFEGAENMVIDKRIRDVAKRLFGKEDIVELDLAELEANLLVEVNEVLKTLGVQLNFITLTFTPDEQTRQAIDVATAMKIYASKNLVDVGKDVMINRAGAPRIVIEVKDEARNAE